MRFRRGAKLDTGQVTDLRGRRMGAPGGVAIGGGALGLAGLVVYLLVTLLSGGGGLGQLGPLDDQSVGRGDTPAEVSDQCADVEDINTRQDCRIIGDVNSIQNFWDGVFQRSNRKYEYVNTIFFDGQVQTGCGVADARVGPFYCPVDKLVYIDLGFFDDLQSQFGAAAAPFVEAYVIAHEYGHHVQDQLGILNQISGRPAGPGEPGRPLRAAGRLLCRSVGRPRGRRRHSSKPLTRERHQQTASTRPRRSATTGSRSALRDRSTRRPGRTVPRSSGEDGSRGATSKGVQVPATRSRARSSSNPA